MLRGLAEGRKVVVAVVPSYRDAVKSWSALLRERRIDAPRRVIGEGHLGIWGALRQVWPQAARKRKALEQWCSRHGYGKAAKTVERS